MTDQNPMRIAEEMRRLRAAATQGEWSRRHPRYEDGVLVGFADRPDGWNNEVLIESDPPIMIVPVDGYASDEDTDFIAYAANNAIALADALEEERRHADRLARALAKTGHEKCDCARCIDLLNILATHRERRNS